VVGWEDRAQLLIDFNNLSADAPAQSGQSAQSGPAAQPAPPR
jgi:hypothetical protein